MSRIRIITSAIIGIAACVCWASAARGADGPPVDGIEAADETAVSPESLIDAGNLVAVSQDVPRHRFFVDLEGNVTGGEIGVLRDERGNACVPEGGECGTIVYKNMISESGGASNDQRGKTVLDDIWLAGTQRALCSITVGSVGNCTTYSFSLNIWTDCPVNPGARKLAGPYSSPVLPWGYSETTFALPAVVVPTHFWIETTYTGGGRQPDVQYPCHLPAWAGPLVTGYAEIGFTDDLYWKLEGDPQACHAYDFGGGLSGHPWAGFAYQVSAASEEMGKCCYNNCANCFDTTYASCMTYPGNPEFLLGTDCAELPNCGKGACCTNVAGVYTCVANRTLAECQALTGYVAGSWEIGTDCTAHGPYEEKFCAGPPGNDDCADAELISGTCVTKLFNTAGAVLDLLGGSYYTVSCLEGPTPSSTEDDVLVTNNIWYKYQIPTIYDDHAVTTGEVVLSTVGSRYDTVLAVWGIVGTDNDCTAATCGVVTAANEIACNDDIIPPDYTEHGHVQASYVKVEVSAYEGDKMRPGSCIYIMVSGLSLAGNPPGGPGQLNVDFFPIDGDYPWGYSTGVCCLSSGCIIANDGDCYESGGYHRAWTDFYEGGASPPYPFENKAGGCCHGEFGSCQEGEYCGKPIVLSDPNAADSNFVWPDDFPPATGLAHRVTYFKFTPRDLIGTETEYYLTIDTCGSEFDTVLSVYGETLAQDPYTTNFGECEIGTPIARNDNCLLSTYGAEGRVSCVGVATTESCLCLKVGEGGLLPGSGTYYIGVGMKDTRDLRAEGIDPAPNYPIDQPVGLKITMKDTWPNCLPCDKQCCKGDIGGGLPWPELPEPPSLMALVTPDGIINGKDIQGMVSLLCSGDAANLDCQAANDVWCRANMNNDAVVDLDDIPAFVNALLIPWPCDFTPYCEVEGYCQLPNQPWPHGSTLSDLYKGVKMADNFFSPPGGQITRVCWWGCYIYDSGSFVGPCTPTVADDFAITFYSNLDNRPGRVIAQYSNIKQTGGMYTLVKTATGRTIDGGAPEYKYEVTGLPPTPVEGGNCTWIEIVNNGDANCWWWWETQTNAGDDYAAEWQYGYYRWVEDTDFAFCVNIPISDQGCAKYCDVPFPPGGVAEGEPVCYDGYVDEFNGSCELAQAITCGQTVCGTSGVYLVDPWEPDRDWYKLVVTSHEKATLTVKAEFAAFVGFMEYSQNMGSGNCADLSGNIWPYSVGRCLEVSIEAGLPPGTYYIVVMPDLSDPFYYASLPFHLTGRTDCGMKYTLSVGCEACPSYQNCITHACPGSGYTAEGEPCGADTNGGCDSNPPAFGTIAPAAPICGTVWADLGRRDTDWFVFSLTCTRNVAATLKSEFPGAVYLMRVNNCAAYDIDILAAGYSLNCSTAVAQAQLDPLTVGPDGYPKYVVFVAPATAAGPIYNCLSCADDFIDYDLELGHSTVAACSNPIYCQPWLDADYNQRSDMWGTTQYRAADDFYPTTSGGITHVCWWGVMADASTASCSYLANNFNIAFYQNNNGKPGTQIGSTRVVGNVAGIDTCDRWDPSGYDLPIYLWQADFATPGTFSANTCYWLAIWNTTGQANGCYFRLLGTVDASPGNGRSGYWAGTSWVARTYDVAFCINRASSATSCP